MFGLLCGLLLIPPFQNRYICSWTGQKYDLCKHKVTLLHDHTRSDIAAHESCLLCLPPPNSTIQSYTRRDQKALRGVDYSLMSAVTSRQVGLSSVTPHDGLADWFVGGWSWNALVLSVAMNIILLHWGSPTLGLSYTEKRYWAPVRRV